MKFLKYALILLWGIIIYMISGIDKMLYDATGFFTLLGYGPGATGLVALHVYMLALVIAVPLTIIYFIISVSSKKNR